MLLRDLFFKREAINLDCEWSNLLNVIFLARLSISFRFVGNGQNILYQFTKRNKFHLILNLGSFRIFRLNSARNVPVSFYMFRFALEKPLNQIEPCSISLIKPPNYKKLIFITIFINNDINFLKLDLSLIYIVYIHVFFSYLYFVGIWAKQRML